MTRSGSSTDEGLCLSSSSDSEQSKDDDVSKFQTYKNLEYLREKTRIKTTLQSYQPELIIEYLMNMLSSSTEPKMLTAFRLLFPETSTDDKKENIF